MATVASLPPLPELAPVKQGMFGDRYGWLAPTISGCQLLSRLGGDYRKAADLKVAIEKARATKPLRDFVTALSDVLKIFLQLPSSSPVDSMGTYIGQCLQLTLIDLRNAGVVHVVVNESGDIILTEK